jgi:hypothetical protein
MAAKQFSANSGFNVGTTTSTIKGPYPLEVPHHHAEKLYPHEAPITPTLG